MRKRAAPAGQSFLVGSRARTIVELGKKGVAKGGNKYSTKGVNWWQHTTCQFPVINTAVKAL